MLMMPWNEAGGGINTPSFQGRSLSYLPPDTPQRGFIFVHVGTNFRTFRFIVSNDSNDSKKNMSCHVNPARHLYDASR